jgi:hypothetical protein
VVQFHRQLRNALASRPSAAVADGLFSRGDLGRARMSPIPAIDPSASADATVCRPEKFPDT